MSAVAGRMTRALPRVVPIGDALRSGAGIVTVAVVAETQRLVDLVDAALRRDGMAADVELGGHSRLALDRLTRLPDVVLLSGDAAVGTTAEVRRIRRRLPDVRMVLVVDAPALGGMRHVLDAGVDGIVLADALAETLAIVVRSVCAGLVSVPRTMRHAVDPPALSFRERQILALVVAGLTNDEIAGRLYLAETTIKGHLTSAFRRLGVRSRREAVALILSADESLRRSVLTAVPGGPDPDPPEGGSWQ
jgi:DNA-binding NarL/FixJ family response regulator